MTFLLNDRMGFVTRSLVRGKVSLSLSLSPHLEVLQEDDGGKVSQSRREDFVNPVTKRRKFQGIVLWGPSNVHHNPSSGC